MKTAREFPEETFFPWKTQAVSPSPTRLGEVLERGVRGAGAWRCAPARHRASPAVPGVGGTDTHRGRAAGVQTPSAGRAGGDGQGHGGLCPHSSLALPTPRLPEEFILARCARLHVEHRSFPSALRGGTDTRTRASVSPRSVWCGKSAPRRSLEGGASRPLCGGGCAPTQARSSPGRGALQARAGWGPSAGSAARFPSGNAPGAAPSGVLQHVSASQPREGETAGAALNQPCAGAACCWEPGRGQPAGASQPSRSAAELGAKPAGVGRGDVPGRGARWLLAVWRGCRVRGRSPSPPAHPLTPRCSRPTRPMAVLVPPDHPRLALAKAA